MTVKSQHITKPIKNARFGNLETAWIMHSWRKCQTHLKLFITQSAIWKCSNSKTCEPIEIKLDTIGIITPHAETQTITPGGEGSSAYGWHISRVIFSFPYTLCLKKNDNDVLRYNFKVHQPILIIFGRDIAEWICY